MSRSLSQGLSLSASNESLGLGGALGNVTQGPLREHMRDDFVLANMFIFITRFNIYYKIKK